MQPFGFQRNSGAGGRNRSSSFTGTTHQGKMKLPDGRKSLRIVLIAAAVLFLVYTARDCLCIRRGIVFTMSANSSRQS